MSSPRALDEREVAAFHRDGYVLRKGLFDREVVEAMNDVIAHDPAIHEATYARRDASGASTELALWYSLGEDIFGAVARCQRVVDSIESLLGGPASFYHAKLTLKRPRVGGAWEWHQDYGYWYKSGFLFPDMASVFIAVDPSTRENGCLQVIPGSHRLGRIEHGTVGGQTGADAEVVEQALKRMGQVDVEMEPGDALFFHCNTLHASGRNNSERSRNILLSCYNRTDNAPYRGGPNISHTPIKRLPDEELTSYIENAGAVANNAFYKPQITSG